MSSVDTESGTRDWLGPDPGPRIRQTVALMLRLAFGVSLLSAGLARYMGSRPGSQVPGMVMVGAADPLMAGLAYLSIALGIALILGFFLTLASTGACLVILAIPVLQTITELTSGGFGPGLNDPYLVATTQRLPMLMVPAAMMLWLSPVANHPYSIDALIFARDREARAIRPPAAVMSPEPARPEAGLTIE